MLPNNVYNNFATGELSPNVWGRSDRPFYTTGLEVCRNYIPLVTGGAMFRPGLAYANHTRLNKVPFFMDFEFNAEQAYTLEFTDAKMRVWKNGALVTETAKNIEGITQANPGVITITSHGFSDGDEIYISGIVGMTELNGNFYLVDSLNANTFHLTDIDGNDIDTSTFTAWASAGTVARVYEITSPYAAADLSTVKYAQTADLAYLVHPSYAPYKLTRSGHAAWTLATYSRTSDPFSGANLYPAAVGFYGGRCWMGGSNTDPDMIYGSRGPNATTGASQYEDFTVGTADNDGVAYTITPQTGTALRVRWFSATSLFMVIGTYDGVYKANGGSDGVAITPTKIDVKPMSAAGVANAMAVFVNSITAYIQLGGKTLRTFEYSFLDDSYTAFDRNTLADEIAALGITKIAYTRGRPDIIWGVRSDGVLLSCTILSREEIAGWARHYIGGTDVKVLEISAEAQTDGTDKLVACVERTIDGHTRRYVEYMAVDGVFPEESDYFTAEADVAINEQKYRALAFESQKKFNRLDSSLVLDQTQTVALTLGAVSGLGVTCTAASSLFAATDIGRYIFVKYITGLEEGVAEITGYTSDTVVTVNIKKTFSSTAVAASGWFLTTTTIRGLGHLEGQSVSIVTDGGQHPNETVTDGLITLDYPTCYAIIGLAYKGMMRLPEFDFGTIAGAGSALNRPKNIGKIGMKVRNTLGGKFGTALNRLVQIDYRVSGKDYTDRPPLLKNGWLQLSCKSRWENDSRLYIVQDSPFPMTVLSVVPEMDVTME